MKLGVGDIIQSAALSLWRGGWPMSACLILWAGADFASRAFLIAVGPATEVFPAESNIPVDELIGGFLRSLVGCVFVAAILRIILIGSVLGRPAGSGGLARASGAVLLVNLGLILAIDGPLWLVSEGLTLITWDRLMGLWMPLARLIRPGIVFAVIAAQLYVIARLCLLYPSAAIARGGFVLWAWRHTAGNGIRLTALLAMVWVFTLTSVRLVDMTLFGGPFVPDVMAAETWGTAARETFERVAASAILLALSAVAYAKLTDYPATGVPGAGPTPVQLAKTFE